MADRDRTLDPSSSVRPILLVEDNPVDLDLTLRAFAKRKMINPVDVARDGQEAVDKIVECETSGLFPLVVLLDLQLPKIHGLEVLRAFKEHPEMSRTPVVVLTSSSEDRDIEEAYQLGANSYIVKPVDFDKFSEVAAEIELYWCVLNQSP